MLLLLSIKIVEKVKKEESMLKLIERYSVIAICINCVVKSVSHRLWWTASQLPYNTFYWLACAFQQKRKTKRKPFTKVYEAKKVYLECLIFLFSAVVVVAFVIFAVDGRL